MNGYATIKKSNSREGNHVAKVAEMRRVILPFIVRHRLGLDQSGLCFDLRKVGRKIILHKTIHQCVCCGEPMEEGPQPFRFAEKEYCRKCTERLIGDLAYQYTGDVVEKVLSIKRMRNDLAFQEMYAKAAPVAARESGGVIIENV